MVLGTTAIKDTHTASLYELAFTATHSVSGQCWEVKQQSSVSSWIGDVGKLSNRARLVAVLVTQALEQGRLGSCVHAGYNQYYKMNCYTDFEVAFPSHTFLFQLIESVGKF